MIPWGFAKRWAAKLTSGRRNAGHSVELRQLSGANIKIKNLYLIIDNETN